VSTLDIIGGNSGSPVLNRDAQVVGVVFDGNMQSLGGVFFYDDTANRAVSVHSAGLIESLKGIYNAQPLLKELQQAASLAASAGAATKH
jgi:S1-C subfamily serine protease